MLLHQQIVAQQNTVQKRAVVQLVHQECLGLKVKRSCTSTSDAVCEVLDGFFCSDSNRGGCRAAQRHRLSCSPGYYIGQRGTADKDTECLHCTDGTFSDGTSSSCQNHTKCESVGLKLMRPGTDSTDSECGEHGQHRGLERGHVAGIIPGVVLVMALIIIAIICRKKIREWRLTSKMETLSQELCRDYRLRGIYSPAPTRDQQEHPTTTPAATMDDHDGDQSLGPAPPPQAPHIMDLCCSHNILRTISLSSSGQTEDRFSVPLTLVPPSPSRSTLSLGPPSPSQSTPLTLVPPSPSRST
ncbi:uncharacterized protein LOC115553049, partial [Gadus morhua]|uniref:uncharacterized protein LOC115553049 n=1 Tax=Gadus morhua TaxID=8049 RepID=UPI0011B7293E